MNTIDILNQINEHTLEAYLPKIYKDVIEYGLTNIFILESKNIRQDFESYYYIKYFNNVTGEIISDKWNSADANLPSISYYIKPFIHIKEAINNGFVNLDMIIDIIKRNVYDNANQESFEFSPSDHQYCKVNICGGRKFKGEAYYLHINVDNYGNESAVVYDEKTNTVHEVSARYLQFDESIEKEYLNWVKSNLNNFTIDNISGYGFNKDLSFSAFINEVKMNYNLKSLNLDTVNYPARDKRIEKENAYIAKQKAFKEYKMKQLLEWVLNNTDKKGDDAIALAERIFNKKYNQY